jgi:pimeloyl-ACP methyl ester carboxylesterase
MRHFAGAFVCALFVLGLGREAAHAQSSAPTTASKFETEPFSGAELLRGKRITQAECAALPGAVWAAVDQQGECIRYYHSTAGGSRSEVVVFFSIEAASTNARGEVKPYDSYAKQTSAAMQERIAGWSRGLRMPYLYLARPGSYGSSGEYAKRRTPGEIDLISAALDAIKSRHGYTRLHLAGYSEGGHAAAALLARRGDLGCVVLASSLLSVRSRLAEAGSGPGRHRKQTSRRSRRARRSGGKAPGSSHHRRNRPRRCRYLRTLANRLREACQRGRFADAANLRGCH